ncbi:hypothetical protein [Pseudonocardia sp. T1-2H]|uniref:hypothetical protein n=1 Tax=Pseudonocardia sp. T1-2H TaxID=3128899 RepID=UPI00310100A8
MNYSAQLDALQRSVAEAKAAVDTAGTESRDQLRQRIDQAQAQVDLGVQDAEQHAGTAGTGASSKWAQMKADAAAKMDDIKAKIDERNAQLDADIAADDAAWADEAASAAIDYAGWAVDNARLAVLDAIDARACADERAKATSG